MKQTNMPRRMAQKYKKVLKNLEIQGEAFRRATQKLCPRIQAEMTTVRGRLAKIEPTPQVTA